MKKVLIDEILCNNCLDCMNICPVKVFELREKKIYPADENSCLGASCKHCSDSCWSQAIIIL